AIVVFVLLLVYHPITSVLVFPFLSVWFASPFIVWYISKPSDNKETGIAAEQSVYLRMLARKTWSFFETFVVKEDNWLPPDNYQEQPVERIAHRTSPTNIGLSLLANLTAFDFGYITGRELIDLTDKTTSTMLGMEKYRGHLYNWYDTQTILPLTPRYISTVDSGNLVGHLITLRQGILTIPDKKIVTEAMFEGLLDEGGILLERTDIPELKKFKEELKESYSLNLNSPLELKTYLKSLEDSLTKIFIQLDTDPETETEWWIQKLFNHIKNINSELTELVPWLNVPKAPEKFKDLIPALPGIPTMRQLSKIEQTLLNKVKSRLSSENSSDENHWLEKFSTAIIGSGRLANEMILCAEQLATRCAQLSDIDYDFLYDKSQHLLTIGYNTEDHRKDNSYYDLLASEARLATFVAIAQGKLPQQSWFALGRQLTHTGTTPVLLSWSGSMFEYLMPLLVMPTYKNTLLQQTMQAVIQKQIDYGKKRGVPWGVSESGYNRVDANLNYQYHAFGVPGLGFKRGLG
ncbi:MAG: cyclic beta 1-2 glucan synthetase, partial [Bacteroidota bacterium]